MAMGSVAHVYSDTSTLTRMWLLAAGGPLEPLRRRHWRLIPRYGRTNALCVLTWDVAGCGRAGMMFVVGADRGRGRGERQQGSGGRPVR